MNRIVLFISIIILTACSVMDSKKMTDDEHPSGAFKEVREIAEESWLYSQLSSNVYGERDKYFKSPYVTELEPEYTLSSGFKARVYEVKLPESDPLISIAYAGTEGWLDWILGNLNPFNTQYKQGLDYLEKVKAKYSNYEKIVVTGHSLGGAISIYAASREPNIKAYVFNPSIRVRGGEYGTHENIQSVSQYAEVLSGLRKILPNPNGTYTTIGCFKANALDRHKMKTLAECLTHISAWESNEALESLKINGLGDRKSIDRTTNTLTL